MRLFEFNLLTISFSVYSVTGYAMVLEDGVPITQSPICL